MMQVRRITDTDGDDFAAAMLIYEESFPSNEKQPLELVRERVRRGNEQLIAGEFNGEIAVIALLWALAGTEFLLLDYLATKYTYRGMRLGTQLLASIKQELEKSGQYLIIEAEDPQVGENRMERAQRIAFYRRNGARVLKDVRYIVPALDGSHATEMILMMLPPLQEIDSAVLKRIISRIYEEVYNTSAVDVLRINASVLSSSSIKLV